MENEWAEEFFGEKLDNTDKLPIEIFVALLAVESEQFLVTDMSYICHTHLISCFPSAARCFIQF